MKKGMLLLTAIFLLFLTGQAEESTIRISDELISHKGRVTIYWRDDAQAGPYTLLYQCVEDTLDRQASYIETGIDAESFTLDFLAPGGTYQITVTNSAGDSGSAVIALPPAADFEDGKLNRRSLGASAELCQRSREEGRLLRHRKLSGEEIANTLETTEYGILLELSYPELAKDRTYTTQVVLRAPGGFETVYNLGEVRYNRLKTALVYFRLPFLGGEFFEALYQSNGTIPCGMYTVRCYWDGMLMGETGFEIN